MASTLRSIFSRGQVIFAPAGRLAPWRPGKRISSGSAITVASSDRCDGVARVEWDGPETTTPDSTVESFWDYTHMDDSVIEAELADAVTYRELVRRLPSNLGNVKEVRSFRDNVTRKLAPTVARAFALSLRSRQPTTGGPANVAAVHCPDLIGPGEQYGNSSVLPTPVSHALEGSLTAVNHGVSASFTSRQHQDVLQRVAEKDSSVAVALSLETLESMARGDDGLSRRRRWSRRGSSRVVGAGRQAYPAAAAET